MPLYEYTCGSCGAVFERRRNFDQRLSAASCPGCGAEARIRLSAPARVTTGATGSDACAALPPGACCGGGACGPI